MLIKNRQVVAPTDPAKNLLNSIKQVIGEQTKEDATKREQQFSIDMFNMQQNYELPNPDKLKLDGVEMYQTQNQLQDFLKLLKKQNEEMREFQRNFEENIYY